MAIKKLAALAAATFGALSFQASANAAVSTISDIDLSTLTFDIDTLASNPVVTGTSNGVGFTFTAASTFYAPFSNNSASQTYNDIPGKSFDDIHAGADFTIVFDKPIKALLVALGNDNNTGDGPDFGIVPADSTGITVSGTKLQISDRLGSLALLVFNNAVTSITHTNDGQLDGWDLSFFAFEDTDPVPVPAAAPLFLAAALGGVALRRRQRKTA